MQKNFIEDAQKAIAAWDKIAEARRSYEHEQWHCVCVKRYSDGLDRDDLHKIALKVSPKEPNIANPYIAQILTEEMAGKLDGSGNLYDNWLSDAWEQLNYEIGDIVELGLRKTPFKHIKKTWSKNHPFVISLGRSGGWACFKTDADENLADELADLVREYFDPEGIHDKRDTVREIETVTGLLREAIAEIEDLKNFIDKFNKGLDFKDEVEYRMTELAAELEAADKLAQECKIYDTGKNATIDRLTIISGSDAFGMSLHPRAPDGFNQYLGDASKLDRTALGKEIRLKDVPSEVRIALIERLRERN